ncbi:Fur-regulated basic protein FbpA [Metabacillus halosaccharovorans]|uniref:Fur-regulated basic protein FbpA n=1 Tax=Metabacillus halosaccharovorans TaxID=930124 RepID=A0ABT3DIJ6_9BACI|nr:Fur-regulated basic protein FbpA [Metabacillus halosaccharovorans]MCV9886726.1 Fur-regulated basic protein FbpA [Metabacillus halosaccharovorans]
MTKLREAVDIRKEKLIIQLIALGIYKKEEHHLYELTLSEIENEYMKETK